MRIRLEELNDYDNVENLTREAFRNIYRPWCFEHLIIHNLRSSSDFIPELDFVIEDNNKLIWNIVYALWNMKINWTIEKVLIFWPVSILPKYQHQWYGQQLINYSLEKAKEFWYASVFITWNPEYYKKFWFEAASKYNIHYEWMPIEDDAPFFMVKILNENKFHLDGWIYSDPDCYNINESELEEFDKHFSPKEKKSLPWQLW